MGFSKQINIQQKQKVKFMIIKHTNKRFRPTRSKDGVT